MAEARSPVRQSVCRRVGVAATLQRASLPITEIAVAAHAATATPSRLSRDDGANASSPVRRPNRDFSIVLRAKF